MPKKDPRVDAYIAKAAPFAKPILVHLRKLIHRECPEVEEKISWGFPFFGLNTPLCATPAFKAHCAFVFWKHKPILGDDKATTLALRRITKLSDLPSDKVLVGYLRKATEISRASAKVKLKSGSQPVKKAPAMPKVFKAALAKNKKANVWFAKFSASQKREYIDWIEEAKTETTRKSRLATAVEWIAEGKQRNWKYMKR